MSIFRDLCSDGVKIAKDTVMYPDSRGEHVGFWPSVFDHSAHQLFGRPGQVFSEYRTGKAFRPGSYTRQMLWPAAPAHPDQGVVGRSLRHLPGVLTYAPKALELYSVKDVPKEHRGQALGGALGDLAGHMLGAPLGHIGTMGLSMAGRGLGERVGKLFD